MRNTSFFINVASQIACRVDLFCAFPDDRLRDAVAVRGLGGQFKLADESAMKRVTVLKPNQRP